MTISSETKRIQYTTLLALRTYAITFPYQSDGDITVVLREASGNEVAMSNPADYTISGGNVVVNPAFTPWATSNFLSIIIDPPLTQDASLPNSGAFPSAAVEASLDKLLNLAKRTRDIAERSLRYTDGSVIGSNSNYDAGTVRIENVGAPVEDSDAATKASVAAQLAAAILTPSTVVSAAAATVLDDLTTDAMLATLGGGANGITVFKGATAGANRTNLGFSAFMSGRVADADAAAHRTGIEAPKWDEVMSPNLLDNGDFQVWQDGATFNNATPIAGGNNDNVFTADQWILLSNGNNIVTVAKSTSGPQGARGAVTTTQVAADTKWGLLQILPSQRCIPQRGYPVSLSLKALAGGALTDFRVAILSWTGTADAPTRDVVSAWNGATAQFTPVATWAIVSETTFTAGAFNTVTLENVTVPVGCNNLAVFVYTNDPSFGAGAVNLFSSFNLVEGSRALQFRSRSLDQEIAAAERYYQKTFALETYPATNVGLPGALQTWLKTMPSGAGNPRGECQWSYRTRMWRTPHTVSAYNPYAANNLWGDGSGNTLAVTATAQGETGTFFETAQGAAAGTTGRYAIHASASARYV